MSIMPQQYQTFPNPSKVGQDSRLHQPNSSKKYISDLEEIMNMPVMPMTDFTGKSFAQPHQKSNQQPAQHSTSLANVGNIPLLDLSGDPTPFNKVKKSKKESKKTS